MSTKPSTQTPPTRRADDARDVVAAIPEAFQLACGDALSAREVRGRLKGPRTGPLVVVAGGISAGRDAAGWWSWAVRDGGPIDTRRVRVLAFDWLPETDTPNIPTITTHDQARLLALLLDSLGETTVDAFVGASYGGCVGLAFAELFPERIGRLAVISAAHRAHSQATAWRGVQRRLLAFGLEVGREADAIDLARQIAMTTYRTAEELDLRFGGGREPKSAGGAWPVCDYLAARGAAYRAATSARRWIALSDSLDRHSVEPERITCPVDLLAFGTDQLVPIDDIRELAARLPNRARLTQAPSLFGHDAFLKEREVVSRVLASALFPVLNPSATEIAA